MSYLNTAPLVWGLVHGPQRGIFEVRFELPSVCADQLRGSEADIGLVPVIEMKRQGLAMFPGCGIACRGPVRSILLVAKKPWEQVRTLAADAGSRTSVMLARIILGRKFGLEPEVRTRRADLDAMLAECDAALVIGDPALHIDPAALPHAWMDLGEEWTRLTGLPMVFAVWAAPEPVVEGLSDLEHALVASVRFARSEPERLAYEASERYGYPPGFLARYFEKLRYSFGPRERAGLYTFLEMARDVGELLHVPELRFARDLGVTL